MIHHFVVIVLLSPTATFSGVKRIFRKTQKVLQAVGAALKSPAD
ncbi:hypothetical protein [Gluconobacter albidus]|nr:hypothetical protein [Gluconobacter albidus]